MTQLVVGNWSGTGREIGLFRPHGELATEPKTGDFRYEIGGGGGIRTHEGCYTLTVFKTVAFVRSATPPQIQNSSFFR